MADTAVAITAGTGTNIDTRTEGTNGNHRQVVVVGDPATNAGVAPVDATAGLKVDLGADNDITGTVTANLGATDNAVLDAIEVDTTTIAGAVAGTEMQVDVVGALPAGTNAIGKLAANSGVDIGDTDVTSVIPGTGATNLGKAIDSVVGATDTGVAMLAKRSDEDNVIAVANGDYDMLRIDARGALHASPEQHIIFDGFEATTGWSALGNDTLNLATTLKHLTGTLALTFDKVNGAANTVFAGIQKTITSTNLGDIAMHDLIQGSFYIPDITNVSYVFFRLGTDSTNYNEWRIPDTNITQATFLTAAQGIGDATYAGITGNGWNPSAITYIAVGVAFDTESDTLAGIIFDRVSYHTNLHTSAAFSAEISSDVTTPNINVHRMGGVATATNAGVNSNGVQRVTIATDDEINDDLDAIKTAVEILDNTVAGTEMQVDVVASLPAGTNNIGDVDVLSSALPTGASTSAKQDTVIGHLDGVEGLLTTIDADTSNLSVVGGGTEAAAIRVTIANNSTGVLSVDDNGGALTVDGTVTVGNPEAIGGGTQYAVDAALGATPTGTLGVAIRDDALSALTPVEGDAIGLRVDANGALWTHDDALDAAISGSELQVDVVASLPAGTNNIGDVDIASIAAGDNNIGNVDIVTMPTVTVNSHAVTNAGTFATQATLQAGTAYAGKVRLTDGTTDTDIRDLTNSNALNVAIVDGTGDQITTFGGGTQYTEDAASAANPVGTAPILIRSDTPATQVTTDGDNIAQRGTNYGAAYTQLVTSSGAYIDSVGGGTEYTEDVATANPIVGKAIMVERDDALTAVTPVEGDNIGLRGTAEGALWTQDFNSDGILADTTAIKTAVETIDNAIAGSEMQVDIVGALPAGTNAIGKLAANSGVDIGDVTIDNAAGAAAVNIQDGGNTITVDGTVAVTGVSTAANQTTIIGHVDGIEGLLTTIDADTGSIMTAVQLLDDSVATLGTDTYTEASSKGLTIGAVRRDADTTLVGTTNEFGPLQMDANGRLKVEAFSGEALPVTMTSTTVTGTVAVTQSGTWDEVGINDSGNSITVDNAQLSVVGSGTEATAMRVTLATDSTGLISVDDNGSSLTVDYATTGSGTATGALRVELANNGTGVLATVGAVTAITNALPAGTNAIGKLAANSGVDIGDVTLTAGTAAIGTLLPPDIDVTAHTNYTRKYYTSAGAATDGIVWSPAAGKRWHIHSLFVNVSAAATVTFEDDLVAGDAAVLKMELAANSGTVIPFPEKYPLASGEDAADLLITTTAGNVYVTVVGYEI